MVARDRDPTGCWTDYSVSPIAVTHLVQVDLVKNIKKISGIIDNQEIIMILFLNNFFFMLPPLLKNKRVNTITMLS